MLYYILFFRSGPYHFYCAEDEICFIFPRACPRENKTSRPRRNRNYLGLNGKIKYIFYLPNTVNGIIWHHESKTCTDKQTTLDVCCLLHVSWLNVKTALANANSSNNARSLERNISRAIRPQRPVQAGFVTAEHLFTICGHWVSPAAHCSQVLAPPPHALKSNQF